MTDYVEEQANEIEALQSIYSEEFTGEHRIDLVTIYAHSTRRNRQCTLDFRNRRQIGEFSLERRRRGET